MSFANFKSLTVYSVALGAVALVFLATPARSSEDPLDGPEELTRSYGEETYMPDHWGAEFEKPLTEADIYAGSGELDRLLEEPAAPTPASFSDWYHRLDAADKQRLRSMMAQKGMANDDGGPLSEEDFAATLPFFDRELRKEAKTEEQRAAAFREIQNETGIMPSVSDSDLDGLGDFGVTGSTGPRSTIDPRFDGP